MPPLVSVVIPTLNDSEAAAALLHQLAADIRADITLVDGGFDAALGELAAHRPNLRLIRTSPGRGQQMNAGASDARGTWLLFLHADSRLPPGWLEALEALPSSTVGGWFRFALDDDAWQARLIERGARWRVKMFGLPYGDQGLFVRREVFQRLGGYRDLALMEDVDFVRRLRRVGPVREIVLPLVTSARRWRRDGWFRRSARNLMLITLYFAGVPPSRLARWYGRR